MFGLKDRKKKFQALLSSISSPSINLLHTHSSKAPLALKWLVFKHVCLTVIGFKLAPNKQLAVKVLTLKR